MDMGAGLSDVHPCDKAFFPPQNSDFLLPSALKAAWLPCCSMQVFEKLGLSLFDYMRKNGYKPFPLDLVQVGRKARAKVQG